MAEMGRYCKAYHAKRLREFDGWKEDVSNLRGGRTSIEDDDILYIQENYIVTDGVFIDQNIVYDDVTDEWKAFCQKVLEFEGQA